MDLILFRPIFQERVWGGRRLEALYGRELPRGVPVGESWEVVDRPEAQSVVRDGAFAGRTLHELWTHHRAEVFGRLAPGGERFPILVKLLDAAEKLSLQVHPPASEAARLNGEPKTEMWYILDAAPGAELYVGLKRGVTRAAFEQAMATGRVAECFHRIGTRAGDCMFLPSGRVHAIGAGHLIAEIQQNSDTTFRVHDWDRLGLDGKPRALHLAESLACIDFGDHEPGLQVAKGDDLVRCPHFTVSVLDLEGERAWDAKGERFHLFLVVSGGVEANGRPMAAGEFFLAPAAGGPCRVRPAGGTARLLCTTW